MSKLKIILTLSGYQLTWLMCVFGEVVYNTYIPGLICGLVFTSGAGMSLFIPMIGLIARKNRRDNLSSSKVDKVEGSTEIPPFPPP